MREFLKCGEDGVGPESGFGPYAGPTLKGWLAWNLGTRWAGFNCQK